MDIGLKVAVSAVGWMGEDRIEVSMGAVRGGKYVVEFTAPDNVEHYWFDSYEAASEDFIYAIAANVRGMDKTVVF